MNLRKWSNILSLFLVLTVALSCPVWAAVAGKTFRIVLVPERNIFAQQRKYRVLCDHIRDRVPVTIRADVLKGYKEVLQALANGEAEGGFLGSFASDLSFVFVNPHTSAGYFYPLAILREKGIKDPAAFFSRIQLSGSHDAALWMVANGMADLGAAKNTIYEECVRDRADLKDGLEVLYRGGHYPDSTLVVAPRVPPEVREALRMVFLRMSGHNEGMVMLRKFGARRFVNALPEDYEDARRVVRDSGYDLAEIEILDR